MSPLLQSSRDTGPIVNLGDKIESRPRKTLSIYLCFQNSGKFFFFFLIFWRRDLIRTLTSNSSKSRFSTSWFSVFVHPRAWQAFSWHVKLLSIKKKNKRDFRITVALPHRESRYVCIHCVYGVLGLISSLITSYVFRGQQYRDLDFAHL